MPKIKNEQELLAYNNNDNYMDKPQQDFFQHRLENDKSDLIHRIEEVKAEIAVMKVETGDENDKASIDEIVNRNLILVQRQTKLLHKIESALNRLAVGEFGYCELTGNPIGVHRLLARPTTTRSIEAKEAEELRER